MTCLALLSNIIAIINKKMLVDYVIVETKTTVLFIVNVYKHVSFTRLMSSQINIVVSTMVLVTENLNLAT